MPCHFLTGSFHSLTLSGFFIWLNWKSVQLFRISWHLCVLNVIKNYGLVFELFMIEGGSHFFWATRYRSHFIFERSQMHASIWRKVASKILIFQSFVDLRYHLTSIVHFHLMYRSYFMLESPGLRWWHWVIWGLRSEISNKPGPYVVNMTIMG